MRERGGRDTDDLIGSAVIEEEGVTAHDCATREDDVRDLALFFIFLERLEDGVSGARAPRYPEAP